MLWRCVNIRFQKWYHCVRFQVLTAVKRMILFFWDVTPSRLLRTYQRFGETFCFHLQGWKCTFRINVLSPSSGPWRWIQYVSPKRTNLHGVTTRKINIVVVIILSTSRYAEHSTTGYHLSHTQELWDVCILGHLMLRTVTSMRCWRACRLFKMGNTRNNTECMWR
jgi:hypothetical protein